MQPAPVSPSPVADDVIRRYLANLAEQRQLSPHTVDSYGRDLHELAAMVQTLPRHSALDPAAPSNHSALAQSAAP